MSKILVSSKSLGDAIKAELIDEMCVDLLGLDSKGHGYLFLKRDGLDVAHVSVISDGQFNFRFKSEQSFIEFRAAILKMTEQPINISSLDKLHVSHISIFE